MNRRDIIRMAREAGLGATLTHDGGKPRVWIEGADWHDELERFAALVATEVDKNWVQGKAKISVPTATMEQEFNNYHRLGYKAGAAAEREACARVCDEVAADLYMDSDAFKEVHRCAKAIRARGNV